MRNPWNNDFADANPLVRDRRPGFSMRAALLIVIGNAATMTAAHALAGGFGRALDSTRDAGSPAMSEQRPAVVEPNQLGAHIAPSSVWTVQQEPVRLEIIEFTFAPMWFGSIASRGGRANHAMPARFTRVTSRSHAASLLR